MPCIFKTTYPMISALNLKTVTSKKIIVPYITVNECVCEFFGFLKKFCAFSRKIQENAHAQNLFTIDIVHAH